MSIRRIERPSVFFVTSSIGVVRTTSNSRSECSAREIQTFWPRMMYLSPLRTAIAGIGQRLDERVGIRTLHVELAPVAVGKTLAEIADAGPQIRMQLCP